MAAAAIRMWVHGAIQAGLLGITLQEMLRHNVSGHCIPNHLLGVSPAAVSFRLHRYSNTSKHTTALGKCIHPFRSFTRVRVRRIRNSGAWTADYRPLPRSKQIVHTSLDRSYLTRSIDRVNVFPPDRFSIESNRIESKNLGVLCLVAELRVQPTKDPYLNYSSVLAGDWEGREGATVNLRGPNNLSRRRTFCAFHTLVLISGSRASSWFTPTYLEILEEREAC